MKPPVSGTLANPPQGMFIDTRGSPTLGLGLCDRCHFRFKLADLYPDPSIPGLMVCRGDLDQFDPYRLPPPPPDKWNLPFVRPDVPFTEPYGTQPVVTNPVYGPEYLTTASGVDIVTGSGEKIVVGAGITGTNAVTWPEPQSNPAFQQGNPTVLDYDTGIPLTTGPDNDQDIDL